MPRSGKKLFDVKVSSLNFSEVEVRAETKEEALSYLSALLKEHRDIEEAMEASSGRLSWDYTSTPYEILAEDRVEVVEVEIE